MNKIDFYVKVINDNITKYSERFDLIYNKKIEPLYENEELFLYSIFHVLLFEIFEYLIDLKTKNENYIISEKDLKLKINEVFKKDKYNNYVNVKKHLFKELFKK